MTMTEWCHEFDFTQSDCDFTGNIVASSRGNRAFYSPPGTVPPAAVIGWIAANNFRGLVQIQSPIFPKATLTSFTMTISSSLTGSFHNMEITMPNSNGTPDHLEDMGSTLVHTISLPSPGVPTTSFFLGACSDLDNPGQPYTGAITKLVVRGTGANPFVPSYSLATEAQVPGQTAYIYRAPITGNPSETSLTVDNGTRPIIIDSYAIDPLTQHLWLHAVQGWLKVTACDYTSGTILKPDDCYWTQDDTYTRIDMIRVAPYSNGNLSLPIQEILNCISNGVANASYELPPLIEIPWELSTTQIEQVFTEFPKSLEQVCASTRASMYGVGCETGACYDPPGKHAGLDVFGPVTSNVYSMGDNGLVVGIGVGLTLGAYQQRSCARWGASDVTENTDNKGYSVIVRHGHLYVLYGHMKLLASELYVGKKISAGALLGETGTSTNPGAVPHVHIEVRSFGVNVPTGLAPNDKDPFIKDQNDGNNSYGILANGGKPALNIYEAAQFFAPSVTALISDSSSSTSVAVTGLGKAIANGDKVTFDTTPPSSCGLPTSEDDKPQLEYCCGAIGTDVKETAGGYRGFQLSQQNVIAPEVEPTYITTIP